ncbi:hypothetical protein IMSHALPRED_009409 [Imshaugia aleurites]|uniref:Protein kinase domain-containing protein n=1 Tax=Imshaugia aleurites TaxID=172621 RepID=A0A8H3FZN5_9LECA|nr:hypothetical protein IMSHALPRED_009409 [Imshaugia aleurites]
MAEAILTIVAFPVAVFTTLEAFQRCGEYIAKKVQSYKHAPKAAQNFQVFGTNLHQGLLKDNLEIAQWAFQANSNISSSSKKALESSLQSLKETLITADKLLDKFLKDDGSVHWRYRMLDPEQKFAACFKDLQSWQSVFVGIISILDKHRQVKTQRNLLTARKFVTKSRLHNSQDLQLDAPHLWLGLAQMTDSKQFRDASVAIEKREYSEFDDKVELGVITSDLAHALSDESRGIMKCLGYRETPRLELIFELPSGVDEIQTLCRLMLKDLAQGYAGRHSLDQRFRLARQLSEAVLSVHTKGLVHKNIRSNTVLIMREKPVDENSEGALGLGAPYLSNWSIVRGTADLSVSNPNDHWEEDIYRHQTCQGEGQYAKSSRYNMGHDIYSLGVCLLELGLWESFIVEREPTDGMQLQRCLSDTFAWKAIKLGYMEQTEIGSTKRVIQPRCVQVVMEALALELLPQRMGPTYANLVVSCLRCLEAGLGGIKDFGEVEVDEVGVNFNEVVVRTLSGLRV